MAKKGRMYKSSKFISAVFLLFIISASVASALAEPQTSRTVTSTGNIIYWPRVDMAINVNEVIGTNKLSLGFHLDHASWIGFVNSAERQQLAEDANFKLIRVFDFRSTTPKLMPCTYFDETDYASSTWDWTHVDNLVDAIFSIGAEPMFCLGWPAYTTTYPNGMAVNATTGLPNPESYAYYATEWVKHFKETGKPVRFYQVMNEPWAYYGWTPNTTKLGYFMEVYTACANSMRAENPNISLSFDGNLRQQVLDYWLANGGARQDAIDFHKYDGYTVGSKTVEQYFNNAEAEHFGKWPFGYYPIEAQQMMEDEWGVEPRIINSESNLNSGWATGTEPLIQKMEGAVWTALVLRMGILTGLSYNVYFEFTSSKSYGEETETGGYGFGMINSDDNKPWYPYYVHEMIGPNLDISDSIVEFVSSSDDLRSLAWIHEQTLNMLLISKVDQPRAIYLQGLQGQLNVSKIDNTIPWENASIQNQVINSDEPIILNGYTVILMQTAAY